MNSMSQKSRQAWRLVSVLLAMMILCAGCSLFRPKIQWKVVKVTETKDSIVYRDRTIHDTLKMEIPIITEKNVTKDDSSHLENKYAVSDAYVRDGLLHHSLRTKPQTLEVPVDIHVTDTSTYHSIAEKSDSTGVEIQYVEKKLSWGQRTKIGLFPWLLLATAGLLVWTFRKWIFKI